MSKEKSQKLANNVEGANNSASIAYFTLGLTVGFIIGTIGTLLLTPVKGTQVREKIKEKVAESVDDARLVIKDVVGDRKKIYQESWKQPKAKPYEGEFDREQS